MRISQFVVQLPTYIRVSIDSRTVRRTLEIADPFLADSDVDSHSTVCSARSVMV